MNGFLQRLTSGTRFECEKRLSGVYDVRLGEKKNEIFLNVYDEMPLQNPPCYGLPAGVYDSILRFTRSDHLS